MADEFQGLVSEALGDAPDAGSGEAAPEPEQTDAAPAEPPAPSTPPEPSAELPPAAAAAAPTPEPAFEIGGQKITASQVAKDPALLAYVMQNASLAGHFARLYEQSQTPQGAQPRPPQQTPPQPTQPQQPTRATFPSADRLLADYKGQLEKAVAGGYFEPEVAEAMPRTLSTIQYAFELLEDTRLALGSLVESANNFARSSFRQSLDAEITGNIAALKDRGEFYAPLGDTATATKFREYLLAQGPNGPTAAQLRNPEFIAGQWWAYNHNNFAQTLSPLLEQEKRRQEAERQRRIAAAGDGRSGPRGPAVPSAAEAQPFDGLVDAHFRGQ